MKIADYHPAPIYHRNIEQGSDDWLALRRGVITASTISKLITSTGKPANNDTSRSQLLQLLGERITGETEASFYGDDMARGHLLEPLARDIYASHRAPVEECGFVTADFDGTVIGYSPDGLVGDQGLIEIKSPRQKNHLRSLLNNEVPVEYVPQVQTGLAVTGRAWCDYISYAPGLPLFVHRCKRDELAIAYLIIAAQAAEVELQRLMEIYTAKAAIFPATEPIQPIQPDQEIFI
jgi:putative phage-type endonuclease